MNSILDLLNEQFRDEFTYSCLDTHEKVAQANADYPGRFYRLGDTVAVRVIVPLFRQPGPLGAILGTKRP